MLKVGWPDVFPAVPTRNPELKAPLGWQAVLLLPPPEVTVWF